MSTVHADDVFMDRSAITRRTFIRVNAAGWTGSLLVPLGAPGLTLGESTGRFRVLDGRMLGGLNAVDGPALINGADWYEAGAAGDGWELTFAPGKLAASQTLVTDLLLDGTELAVFYVTLRAGADGPWFRLRFGLLNQCSARMRMPLELVDQNRWRVQREGAGLK